MEDYQVGQIIFLIGEKSTRVLPIQVIEEVVRTTVDGKIKTYTIKLPDKKETVSDIGSLKGTLFKDTKRLRQFMVTNAQNAIDNMIAEANALSNQVFETYDPPDPEPEEDKALHELIVPEINAQPPEGKEQEVVQLPSDDGIIRVDLGNGKFAKMNTESLQQIK